MPDRKKAAVRFTLDLQVEVPTHWTGEDVEFWLNESSLCASAFLLRHMKELPDCFCSNLQAHVVAVDLSSDA